MSKSNRRKKHNKYAHLAPDKRPTHVHRLATCAKKIRHSYMGGAVKHAKHLAQKGDVVEPYYCPNCNGFHVGGSGLED